MNAAAYVLRKNTGSSGVVQTALTAAAKLADHEIPPDVTDLILRRNLPRDLNVAPSVRALYVELWDALKAEA